MIKNIKKDIESALIKFVNKSEELKYLNKISPVLYSHLKEFILRSGKRIRPSLFALSYKGYENNLPKNDIFTASLCIELLHDFFLIHDDIIDKSELRRGKPTLHKMFEQDFRASKKTPGSIGSDLAIVIADIVFALSIKALLEFKGNHSAKEIAINKLSQAAIFTAIGESIDIIKGSERIESISVKDIFLNYTLKTARYTFEYPLVMGAVLADAPQNDLNMLSNYGVYIGQAFQIQDDILGIFGTEKLIGKSILTDIKESKKTLLIWKAYNSTGSNNKHLIKEILNSNKNTYRDLLKIRRIIKETGAYDYCTKKINDLLNRAGKLSLNLKMNQKYLCVINDFIKQQFCITR